MFKINHWNIVDKRRIVMEANPKKDNTDLVAYV